MGIRQDVKDLTDLKLDSNGVGGIIASEEREVIYAAIDAAIVKGEAGDIGPGLLWNADVLEVDFTLYDDRLDLMQEDIDDLVLSDVTINDTLGALQNDIDDLTAQKIAIAGHSGRSVIGRALNSAGVAADIAATGASQVLRSDPDGNELRFGNLPGSAIDSGSIDLSRLINIPTNRVLGNFSGLTQGVAAETMSNLATGLATAGIFALIAGQTFAGNINAPQVAATGGPLIADRTGDATAAAVIMRADAGFAADFQWQTAGPSTRWILRKNNTAESGANAGSNFEFLRYDDAGSLIGNVFTVARATGILAFVVSPTVPNLTVGDNSTKVANTAYVDAAVLAGFATNDALLFKGVIDASANPNYPAGDKGNVWRISVAGKIGGASGPNVEIGDTLYGLTDGSAAGDHATVGANWAIVQSNLDGAVIGPSAVTDGNPVLFDGTTGKLVKQSTFAAFKTSLAVGFADISGTVADAQLSGSYTGLTSISLSSQLIGTNVVNLQIFMNSTDGADNRTLHLSGGGAINSAARAGFIALYGNEHASQPGDVRIGAGSTGDILLEGAVFANAALNVAGAATFDTSVLVSLDLSVAGGDIINTSAGAASLFIRNATADGSDTKAIFLLGGATASSTRGGSIGVYGNEHSTNPGEILLLAGATGFLNFNGNVVVTGTASVSSTFTMEGNAIIGGTLLRFDGASFTLRGNTVDGSDTASMFLSPAGAFGATRAGGFFAYGNEHASFPGMVGLIAGTGSTIELQSSTEITGNLTVSGQVSTGDAATSYFGNYDDAGAASGPNFVLRRASPSPAISDIIGGWFSQGHSSTAVVRNYAAIQIVIKDPTNAAEDGEIQLQTIQAGAFAARLWVGAGLHHSLATGGDKGAGSMNMDAVYDDNVLLTCMALQPEFIENKTVDLKKWDDLVPDQNDPEMRFDETLMRSVKVKDRKIKRTHKMARLLKALVDDDYDPRSARSHVDRFERTHNLPGMPTMEEFEQGKYPLGEMASRTWLAMELTNLAIRDLVNRIEALEKSQ